MKDLTKAEEQVMQFLWKVQTGLIRDIVDLFENPKPAYTTIATILKILENKGFVGHEEYGKMLKYYPLVSKEKYGRTHFKSFAKRYFNSSLNKVASFFVEDNDVSISELEEIKEMIEKELAIKKGEK